MTSFERDVAEWTKDPDFAAEHKDATIYDQRARIEALRALEAAAGRGLDGTGLDGRVLFGDPLDVWSLGSAEVEPCGVHLDLLLPASVAIDVIERVVRGEVILLPPIEEDDPETDEEWAARLESIAKGPPRRQVLLFAEVMEDKLRENDKRGWRRDDVLRLHARLLEEAGELLEALAANPRSSAAVAREAADVANFAMMVADVCGGLDVKQEVR